MTNSIQRLVRNMTTTLGFATLLPGIVMLMWFYSATVGVTHSLYTIAVALSVTGAVCLVFAVALRLAMTVRRDQDTATREDHQHLPETPHDQHNRGTVSYTH
eukprot:g14431.t1